MRLSFSDNKGCEESYFSLDKNEKGIDRVYDV